MPESRVITSTFAGGELSPLLAGRVDEQRYHNSLARCENWIPLVQGGLQVRPGTIFAGVAKYTPAQHAFGKTKLIPFRFSATEQFIIEACHNIFRFWKFDATTGLPVQVGAPYEVASTYSETEIADLQYRQSADVVFLTHPAHAPASLSRLATDGSSWVLNTLGFNPPPTYEAGEYPATTMYASAATGNGVTFTAGAALFLQMDVGRLLNAPNGAVALITSYTDASNLVGNIIQGSFPLFASPAASQTWWLAGSPGCVLWIVGAGGVSYTGPPGVGQVVHGYTKDATGAFVNAFRSADVGAYLQAMGGTFQIVSFVDATQVTALCIKAPSTFVVAFPNTPGGTWTIEVPAWTAARGYPRAVSLIQQRVVYGGVTAEPDTLRATETGNYYGFGPGVREDDALDFVLATGTVCPIQWMEPLSNLIIGTLSRMFVSGKRDGTAITPTNPSMAPQVAGGACSIVPVVLESSVLYVMRGQRQVGEFLYDLATDANQAFDLTEFANHLTLDVTTDGDRLLLGNAALEQPVPIACYFRADGTICALSYRKKQQMAAWSRQTTWRGATQDQFESGAVIQNPVTKKDQLWVSVIRGTQRFIEVFDSVPNPYRKMDCSTKYSGAATASLSVSTALNGYTVGIRGKGGDGIWRLYPSQVVAAGSVTGLTPTVVEAEVGLVFPATATTLRLEVPGAATLQGKHKGFGNITLRCYDTPVISFKGVRYKGAGAVAGYNPAVVYVIPAGAAAVAAALTDTDVEVLATQYDTDGKLTILQDLPLGGTLLMWTADVAVGK